jgi:heme-degrading monooxygenase HmoA
MSGNGDIVRVLAGIFALPSSIPAKGAAMSTSGICHDTPAPPYYAVIFTSQRTADEAGYGLMAQRMVELAAQQPGYLGVESARGADGLGITVSYWKDLESIAAWKAHGQHRVAQETGKARWYADFSLRVAKVERQSWK